MKKLLGLFCVIHLVCLSLSASSFAVDDLPPDMIREILSHLTRAQTGTTAQVCKNLNDFVKATPLMQAHAEILKTWPGYDEFEKQFVTIPAGFLPGNTPVSSFQADKYPVTQQLWQEIMGSLPQGVEPNCPNCPVTHVNWENQDGSPAEVQDFVARLNARTAKLGCTYDLPTDSQLHYMIRGDVTGTNRDLFSNGVTAQNVDEYVTHSGNSNGRIQPVGQRRLNAFGVELGNLWKMSKDIYNPAQPTWGRSIRGGSWGSHVSGAESDDRSVAVAGRRSGYMGLALVRTCH